MSIFHQGIAATLDKNHVDTDQIIPKQFLTSIKRTGFETALFHDWRYLKDGSSNPEFSLNQDKYQGASILVTGQNFGCGSSREHAPWALSQYGFKVIIAESFADIFYNNCINNHILPICFADYAQLIQFIEANEQPVSIAINLEQQTLALDGFGTFAFDVTEKAKSRLLANLDLIGVTESFLHAIHQFEQRLDENGFNTTLAQDAPTPYLNMQPNCS